MGLFFDWAGLKAGEQHLASLPHMKFRIVTTIFLVMAAALFLMRVTYLNSSPTVLAPSLLLMFLLIMASIRLIFATRLLFSKLVLFASVVLFQAVEFGQSPYLNLTPLTPHLVIIVVANVFFLAFLSSIKG